MTEADLKSIRKEALDLSKELLQANSPEFELDELLILRLETVRRTPVQDDNVRRPVAHKRRLELAKLKHSESQQQPVASLAEQIRRRLRPTHQPTTAGPVRRGRQALEDGDIELALRTFSAEVASNPGNADGWIGLAHSRFLAGDSDGSMAALTQVFEIRPTSNRGYLIRAQVYRSQGDYERARQDLWRLVAKNLTDVTILSEILDEVIGMKLHEDVVLVADAILDIDVDNSNAIAAKESARSIRS